MPPDRPIIYETKRGEKAKNVEAYNEGSDVLLICEVTGGEYRENRWKMCLLMKINARGVRLVGNEKFASCNGREEC